MHLLIDHDNQNKNLRCVCSSFGIWRAIWSLFITIFEFQITPLLCDIMPKWCCFVTYSQFSRTKVLLWLSKHTRKDVDTGTLELCEVYWNIVLVKIIRFPFCGNYTVTKWIHLRNHWFYRKFSWKTTSINYELILIEANLYSTIYIRGIIQCRKFPSTLS